VKAEYKQEVERQDVADRFGFSAKASTESESVDISFRHGEIEGKASKVVEEERVWKWLEPQKENENVPSAKFYLVRK
jgi:hypothetical protein